MLNDRLLGTLSLATPFFVASALSLLALLLIFLFLPESRQGQSAVHINGRAGMGNAKDQLVAMGQALSGPLGILFLMAFLLSFGLTNFEAVFGLYTKARFDYNSGQVGMVLTVIGLISAIIQGGITGPMTRKFGEVAVIRVALLSTAIGFVLLTLAFSDLTVYLTAGYYVLSNAMLNPSVAALISKRSSEQQGMTQGLNNGFQSLGRVIGPLWAGFIFKANIYLPYLSGAAIIFVGFIVSLIWLGRFAQPAGNPGKVSHSPLSAD